jgi:P27 family predicted phage terminase small subunit
MDGMILALYCTAWADFRAACGIVEREGHVTTTAAGNPKTHPAVKARDTAFRQVLLAGEKLGLSPISRRNLKPVARDIDDESKRHFFE